MGSKLVSFTQLEPRRLLWLIGVTFAVILLVYHIDFPYGNVFSTVFRSGNVPERERSSFGDGDLLSNPDVRNLNSSIVRSAAPDTSSSNALLDDKQNGPSGHGIIQEGNTDLDESTRIQQNRTKNSMMNYADDSPVAAFSPEGLREPLPRYPSENATTKSSDVGSSPPMAVKPQSNSSSEIASSLKPNASIRSPSSASTAPDTSSGNKDITVNPDHKEELGKVQDHTHTNSSNLANHSVSDEKHHKTPDPAVISISEMTNLLIQSRSSYRPVVPMWPSPVDQEVLKAKLEIENAPIIATDPNLYAPLYRNVSSFQRSYELMEKMLKVYIYKEGERPIMHQPGPVLKGIYASEGWFMKLLEEDKTFVTKNPKKAHLFYLPFSSKILEEKLYIADSHSHDNLIQYLKDYVNLIAAKHPFWNRTGGADHFLVACHDWAPVETKQQMAKTVRALCNANIKDGFIFGKDVSLPETNVHSPKNLLKYLGGKPPSEKSNLAFFAGKMHGYLRPILLQYWGGKDPDMKMFGKMPGRKGRLEYIQLMKTSKYCICPKGYEVNSPRVVEAIFYECVPVIISDNFVPPFFDVLNWESFAIFVLEKDIPILKKILLSIPKEKYLEMQMRVKKVQQHFLWHAKPIKYDIFHMILHSIWYNRMLQIGTM